MATAGAPHYTFEELGEGIHAAIARRDGQSICNSGLVDLGEAALVFDTGLTPDSARYLRFATERELGRPASLVANSHWHLDHSLGNQSFSGLPIWGTRRTREILLERHDALTAELTHDALQVAVRELEAQLEGARSEGARTDLEFILHVNRSLLAASGRSRIAPPDHTFVSRLSLPGSRGAQLVSYGAGHTAADALLSLPHERVLFAGDLVVLGVQPSMESGDPDRWLGVLDKIERLDPEQIVPGHGPVTTVDGLAEVRGYVSGVLEAAAASPATPLPAAIRRWEGSLSLDDNLRFARGWVASHTRRR
ncbi:MAG TPA: MBL fold metallo-hydrolase [Thermoplasmata archaeon]|nr:MBL fold metallo-hydrolase [Thermoplasmata archaeon]